SPLPSPPTPPPLSLHDALPISPLPATAHPPRGLPSRTGAPGCTPRPCSTAKTGTPAPHPAEVPLIAADLNPWLGRMQCEPIMHHALPAAPICLPLPVLRGFCIYAATPRRRHGRAPLISSLAADQ